MARDYSQGLLAATAIAAVLLCGPAVGRPVDAPTLADSAVPPHETAEEISALHIASMTAWTHDVEPDGRLGPGHMSAYVAYDSLGNAIEQTAFNEDGSVLQKIVNTCDENGYLLESVSEGQMSEADARSVFEYDGDMIVATTSYRPDGSLLVATYYEYDAEGLVQHAVTEVPDAGISQMTVFEYDEGGNAVRTVSYDSEGRMLAATETANSEDGWPVESTALLPDGRVGSITRLEYDAEHRPTLVEVANPAGVILQQVTNVYGSSGKVVETTTANPAAGIEYRIEVEYNEDDMRLTERTYNKLGELVSETRFQYEFFEDEAED